jgi:hypothetical protein
VWAAFFTELFSWLKTQLPQIMSAGAVWIFERTKAMVRREKNLKNKAELETKYLENRNAVEKENQSKSDVDVVRDAISEGERLKRG